MTEFLIDGPGEPWPKKQRRAEDMSSEAKLKSDEFRAAKGLPGRKRKRGRPFSNEAPASCKGQLSARALETMDLHVLTQTQKAGRVSVEIIWNARAKLSARI